MPIYYGTNKIGKIYNGPNVVTEGYYGSNRVFAADKTIDLGSVSIYGSGDYMNNYYSNAHAYKLRINGTWYLKITGKWYSKGTHVSGDVTNFSTNINVGSQRSQRNFNVYEWNNTTTPSGSPYSTRSSYVTTGGTVYLPLGHENVYRVFNQFDYNSTLIQLDPA